MKAKLHKTDTVSHSDFTIGKVRPDEVEQKIAPILEFRKAGWKTN